MEINTKDICAALVWFLVMSRVINDKRERRLPGLLLEGNSSDSSKWRELANIRYKLKKLKESNPATYSLLLSNYIGALDQIKRYIEKAV
jgi:hypothetical protein